MMSNKGGINKVYVILREYRKWDNINAILKKYYEWGNGNADRTIHNIYLEEEVADEVCFKLNREDCGFYFYYVEKHEAMRGDNYKES